MAGGRPITDGEPDRIDMQTTPRLKVQVHIHRTEGGRRLYALFHRCAEKGDYWQPVTGNAEPGEEPREAARREANEEAGVGCAAGGAGGEDLSPCLWVHDWSRDGTRFAEHIYALKSPDAKISIGSEHRAWEWLPYEAALARMAFEGNRRGLALVEEYLCGREKPGRTGSE